MKAVLSAVVITLAIATGAIAQQKKDLNAMADSAYIAQLIQDRGTCERKLFRIAAVVQELKASNTVLEKQIAELKARAEPTASVKSPSDEEMGSVPGTPPAAK